MRMVAAPQSVFSRTPDIQVRIVDGGAVLVDVVSGHVFELNRIGREVWDLIDGHKTVLAVCRSLASRYQVEASVVAADVQRLIDELAGAGLISGPSTPL